VPAEPGGATGQSTSGQDTKEVAKQEAGNVAQSASGAVQQVAGTAKEQAAGVASEAKEHARSLVGETRDQVTMQVMSGQEKAVTTLRSLGEDLQSMAQSSQSGLAGKLASQAADTTQQVVGFLENREPSELLNELTKFARQRPGVFLIGSAVAGMLAGRMTRGIAAANSSDSSPSTSYPPRTQSRAAIDMPAVSATGQSSYASTPAQTYQPSSGTTQSDADFDRLNTSYETGTSTYASDWSDPAGTTGRAEPGTGTVI
jgi:hypothetical protein